MNPTEPTYAQNDYVDEQEPEYNFDGFRYFTRKLPGIPKPVAYFGPAWREVQIDDKGVILLRGLYGKNGRLELIMKLIMQGLGTREISRTTQSTGRTVRKYRGVLQKLIGAKVNCACGKTAAHQNWCPHKLTGGRTYGSQQ